MHVSGVVSDVSLAMPKCGGLRGPEFRHFHGHSLSDSPKSAASHGLFRSCSSFYIPKLGSSLHKYHSRDVSVRVSENPSGDLVPIAPVEFESPVGQLLAQILQTHPHLLPATIDQQLENLESERDSNKKDVSPASQDLLYKRIAKVKEKERRNTLEEIIYCLVAWNFVEHNITMIPRINDTADPTGRVDFWPNQEHKLEALHSQDAYEMIQSHLAIVFGERSVGPLDSTVQISKVKLGKLYAASIMYGYFLKRVDDRFQLERTMKTLPDRFIEDQDSYDVLPKGNFRLWDPASVIRIPAEDSGDEQGEGSRSNKLRSYVMYLDGDTLQRYATIRSKESISLIEKQTQALFGRPDIKIADDGSINASNDQVLSVTFSGLTMLVLEAVAFGSFLWKAESYVESKYHFVKS